MPKLFSINGYHIYFCSNESQPLEPLHVHISKTPHQSATKVWITAKGKCIVANNNDKIPANMLKDILAVLEYSSKQIERDWLDHFGSLTYYKPKTRERCSHLTM